MRCMILSLLLVFLSMPASGHAQERRKIRISNATLSYSALPLVAAREWKFFQEQGLDIEIILMRSAAAAAALVSGDLDYQSGIGPASVSATLSGVDSRALWSFNEPHHLLADGQTGIQKRARVEAQENRCFRFGWYESRCFDCGAGEKRDRP